LILKLTSNQGSRKLEIEVKRLRDEVTTLKAAIEAAIEEAIRNGQKSVDGLNDIPGSDLVSNKDFALTQINADSEVVGWVDDF
jgi:hypothetical protein